MALGRDKELIRGRVVISALALAVALAGVSASRAVSNYKPGDIYRVWLDGHRVNLTHSRFDDSTPVLSLNGRWIAFVSDRPKRFGQGAVYVIGANGGKVTRVSRSFETTSGWSAPVWSPDSSQIAFSFPCSHGATPYDCTYITDLKGEQRLLAQSRTVRGVSAWSPDGRYIALDVGYDRTPKPPKGTIRVVTPNGKVVGEMWGGFVAWSKSDRLAAGLAFPARIRVYDRTGKLLAEFAGPTSWVAWSPSGDRLARQVQGRLIVRGGGGTGQVILNVKEPNSTAWLNEDHILSCCYPNRATILDIARGGASRRVGAPLDVMDAPVVSPDGSRMATIAQASATDRSRVLSVTSLDGSGTRTIARDVCSSLYGGSPQWLPDSRSLVYSVC